MSDTRPTCTVCIANYNGSGLIEACIDSVLAQDCEFPVEIIVHDDASSDDSATLIRRRYPQVHLIASTDNVGFCVSNNRMAAAARGEYLLLLNNDATLLPDALRTLHQAASSTEHPAILGLPQYDAATGALIDMGSRLDPFLNPIPQLRPGAAGMIIGACLWLPKSLWDELGGFPPWFGSLAEDMYLCLAARLRGYEVTALGSSGFRHRVGGSLGGGKVVANRLATTRRRRTLSERNKSFVMCLTYPAPFLHLLLPLHLLLLLAEGLILAIVKRDIELLRSVYLACPLALWRERARLAALRRTLQDRRHVRRAALFAQVDWVPHKLRLLLRHGVPVIR